MDFRVGIAIAAADAIVTFFRTPGGFTPDGLAPGGFTPDGLAPGGFTPDGLAPGAPSG